MTLSILPVPLAATVVDPVVMLFSCESLKTIFELSSKPVIDEKSKLKDVLVAVFVAAQLVPVEPSEKFSDLTTAYVAN